MVVASFLVVCHLVKDLCEHLCDRFYYQMKDIRDLVDPDADTEIDSDSEHDDERSIEEQIPDYYDPEISSSILTERVLQEINNEGVKFRLLFD